jgi:hypothetical protein
MPRATNGELTSINWQEFIFKSCQKEEEQARPFSSQLQKRAAIIIHLLFEANSTIFLRRGWALLEVVFNAAAFRTRLIILV